VGAFATSAATDLLCRQILAQRQAKPLEVAHAFSA
jgi:hypothetical protein